jgi:hypothetical protein
MRKYLPFLLALTLTACPKRPVPPDPVLVYQAECRALCLDELERPITDAELQECVKRRTTGTTIEAIRAYVRTMDEYLELRRPKLSRLHMQGRSGLHDTSGRYVPMRGVSAFQLIEFVAHGREKEAKAFIDAMRPANVFRVFVMLDKGMFTLTPEDGLNALPATLDLAARKGVYLHLTVFAGTRDTHGLDYFGIADRIGAICAAKPACAAVELANEINPVHASQDERFGDLNFLLQLRARVRVHGEIPVSLGSSHDSSDESDALKDGDYLTIHGDRADGDEGWRWVRHTNEQRVLGDRVGNYPWNDEPRRDDLGCDKHLALGALTQMFRIGDTFHYGNGRYAQLPDAAELRAFQCRARGWGLIPDGWSGGYMNAGFAGSPVKGFANAVRIYSSVNGNQAYSLVLGANQVQIEWNPDWPQRELIVSEGGAQLWKVRR